MKAGKPGKPRWGTPEPQRAWFLTASLLVIVASPLCALAFKLLKPPSYAGEKHQRQINVKILFDAWPSTHFKNLLNKRTLEWFSNEYGKNTTKVISLQVYQLSLSQAPRGFGAPYRGFLAFLAPWNCLETAKLRRLICFWYGLFVDQAWGQDGWILAKFFFVRVCLWTKTELSFINTQKGKRSISSHLTLTPGQ